ncbi:tetratricopeptide repeat protein [Spiribacter vilamensis]|uniref:MSHA biogenesis protein MshN n=1 Tax=Spiribacter vilamensis TaxID=531306 RepID=A0A4V2GJ18_9GAMM|nr:tetratricopeptide repeat protein [Spiribacter vilamensis]RZU98605.1 MSHA biogenesis protein MshN [Spiribacter vilamensis]TVO60136.1 tetratricopeptide repeat protein [Spiribacter vilamensis]
MNRQLLLLPLLTITLAIMAPTALAQSEGMQRAPSSVADGERALSLYHQGRRNIEAGELASASRQFREALSLDPGLMVARRAYARILMSAGRPDRAQGVLTRGLEVKPGDFVTARMLARIARDNNDAAVAIRALESIRPPVDSKDTYLRSHLADLYRRTGQHAKAAEIYAELHKADPSDPAWVLGRATSLDHHGSRQEARELWSSLLERDDIDPQIRNYGEDRVTALRDTQIPYGG